MAEVSRVEDTVDEALKKLADAIGQPSPGVLESAKALFPFIAHEAVMSGDAPVAPEVRLSESAGRHSAASRGCRP